MASNPFEGMSFARMGTIYRSFGQFVDGLDATGRGLAGDPKTASVSKGLLDLAKYYRDQVLPQFRTWIGEETTRISGFRVEFTHEQLMLDLGDEPPGHGSAATQDTSQHASTGGRPLHPILGDPSVRQAIAHALEVQTIVESADLFNTWGQGYAAYVAGQPNAFDPFASQLPATVQIAYDPETARRILDEAGWTVSDDGLTYTYGLKDDRPWLDLGRDLLAQQPDPTGDDLSQIAHALGSVLLASENETIASGHQALESSAYLPGSPFGQNWNSAVLYYNRDMLAAAGIESPPTTWEELRQQAEKIRDAEQAHAEEVAHFRREWHGSDHDFKPGDSWWQTTPAKIGGAAAGIVIIGGAIFGGVQLFDSGGGGNDPPVVVNDPSGLGEPDQSIRYDGILSPSWVIEGTINQAARGNLPVAAAGAFVLVDPLNDPFTSFPQEAGGGWDILDNVTLWEMTQATGAIIEIPGVDDVVCRFNEDTGRFEVVCPEGVTGALTPGDYGIASLTLQDNLTARQEGIEYRYDVFLDTKTGPLYVNNPAFPYDTAQDTTHYFEILSTGSGPWSMRMRTFDGQRFQDAPVAPPYDRVRAVVDEHRVMFVIPGDLLGDGALWRAGANVHSAGVNYAPGNVTLDVLGADSSQPLYPFIDFTAGLAAEDLTDDQASLMFALQEYAKWVQTGDGEQIVAHLDTTAIEHYGQQACTDFFGRVSEEPSFGFVVKSISGPAEWEWVYNNETVGTVPDAYTLEVSLLQRNVLRDADVHFALNDEGTLRIFSPCVAPLPPTPAPEPTPTPNPADSPDAGIILAGLGQFAEARRAGNGAGYFDLLHPIVLSYYGEDVCRTFYTTQVGPDPTFVFAEPLSFAGPAPYAYATNAGVTIGTADAYAVVVDTTVQGQVQRITWHFAVVDGQFKIFQPCAR
ncbi:MAG: extracellular solute-binding protein [Chloroflexi bacterium]|nr:extracellular solute-binding protein [Chloroflexota bacterium]